MKLNGKSYMVRSKNRAITISTLLGEDYLQITDKRDGKTTLYMFRVSDRLEKILDLIEIAKEI